MTAPYYDRDGITIYHADCRDVLPHLEPDDYAVMVTDPPYGMSFTNGSDDGRHWRSRWSGHRVHGDDSTIIRDEVLSWWGRRPALVFGTWKAKPPAGVRETLVWDKVVSTGMGALDIPWKSSWEAIYVLGNGFTGQRTHGVLRYPLATRSPDRTLHPTPKPVSLMIELLRKCPAGAVLDPFMGSGPIAAAAYQLGRRYIGIELVEDYVRAAVNRLAQPVLFAPESEDLEGRAR